MMMMIMMMVMMCLKLEQNAYDEDLSPRFTVMPIIHVLFEEINQLFFQIMGSQKTLHIKGDGSKGDLVRNIILKMTWIEKHRKNCECCPGHYLSTSVY